MKYKLPYLKIKRKVVKKYMNVIGKYLKDESGNYISPIVSVSTIFDESNNSLRIDPGLPVGSGCDYYGTTAPDGYLFADGSAISRTEYAELFEVIGTTYGAGDGSTTFNLPDKRERVSVMYKSGSTNYGTLGGKLGSSSYTLTTANLPAHSHSITDYYINTDWEPKTAHRYALAGKYTYDQYNNNSTSKMTQTVSTAKTGSGTAFSVVQPTLVCNYIIKVKSIAANATATILAALEGEY